MNSLFIFRQDLRLEDNYGLRNTNRLSTHIIPLFIFDKQILEQFPPQDSRLGFVSDALVTLDQALQEKGSYLSVLYGNSIDSIQTICKEQHIDHIARNRSYGKNSSTRDQEIITRATQNNITTAQYADYLLIEPEEIIHMKVFTPFKNRRLSALAQKDYLTAHHIDRLTAPLLCQESSSLSIYQGKNLIPTEIKTQSFGRDSSLRRLDERKDRLCRGYEHYDEERNIPSRDGTSKLSPYLRFGIVSIREIYRRTTRQTSPGIQTIVSELARREFWNHIAHHFPDAREQEFQEKKRNIKRDNNTILFQAWCEGRTGYPLVDAGMRQLVSEKWMHNRVRMVVASFLTKDLLIDRRRGEQFFGQHLLDYDYNINTGNRQRSASVGADPKPLRIFSPMLQSQRFDPECKYIKKYIPELQNIHPKYIHDPLKYDLSTDGYVRPIIDHYIWSKKAKELYTQAKQDNTSSIVL